MREGQTCILVCRQLTLNKHLQNQNTRYCLIYTYICCIFMEYIVCRITIYYKVSHTSIHVYWLLIITWHDVHKKQQNYFVQKNYYPCLINTICVTFDKMCTHHSLTNHNNLSNLNAFVYNTYIYSVYLHIDESSYPVLPYM